MNDKPVYKRRIVVIKRSLQFKYATIATVLFGVASFMVWWEIYKSFGGLSAEGLMDASVIRMMQAMSKVVLIKMLVSLVLVWILSLGLSHLVAGPVYRAEKSLEALRDGDLTNRIYLRKHDQLSSLAGAFNATAESLQQKVKMENEKLQKAVALLDTGDGNSSKVQQAIEILKGVNKSFKV